MITAIILFILGAVAQFGAIFYATAIGVSVARGHLEHPRLLIAVGLCLACGAPALFVLAGAAP